MVTVPMFFVVHNQHHWSNYLSLRHLSLLKLGGGGIPGNSEGVTIQEIPFFTLQNGIPACLREEIEMFS